MAGSSLFAVSSSASSSDGYLCVPPPPPPPPPLPPPNFTRRQRIANPVLRQAHFVYSRNQLLSVRQSNEWVTQMIKYEMFSCLWCGCPTFYYCLVCRKPGQERPVCQGCRKRSSQFLDSSNYASCPLCLPVVAQQCGWVMEPQ
jgi:hypothetical protein